MTGSGFCKVLAGESDRAKEPAAFSSEALQLVSECEGHVPPRRGGDGRGLRRGLAGGPLGVSQRGAAGREGFVCSPDTGGRRAAGREDGRPRPVRRAPREGRTCPEVRKQSPVFRVASRLPDAAPGRDGDTDVRGGGRAAADGGPGQGRAGGREWRPAGQVRPPPAFSLILLVFSIKYTKHKMCHFNHCIVVKTRRT